MRLRRVASWASTRCWRLVAAPRRSSASVGAIVARGRRTSNSGRRVSTRTSRRSSTCRTSLPPGSRRRCRCAGSAAESTRGAPYTQDPEAYALYASGRFAWTRQTEPSLLQAIAFFEQAIARDPNYALAYAGLADSYAVLGVFGIRAPHEVFPKARRAVGEGAVDRSGSRGGTFGLGAHQGAVRARLGRRGPRVCSARSSSIPRWHCVSPARIAVRDAGRHRSRFGGS